jgi:hypothetical protein
MGAIVNLVSSGAPGGVGAVDDAMIVRQRQRQLEARRPLAVAPDRLVLRARQAEDGDLGPAHDRREADAADAAQVADREAAARHVVERDLAVARLLGDLRHLPAEVVHAFLVHVAQHRHDQAALGIDGDADVAIMLGDEPLVGQVEAGVELRKLAQGDRAGLDDKGGDRQLLPFLRLLLAERLDVGDVGQVMMRDVRNGPPGERHRLGRFAADRLDRVELDRPPLLEVGQGRRSGGCGPAARGDGADEVLDVFLRDAALGTGARHMAERDAPFARQLARRGPGGDDRVVVARRRGGASNRGRGRGRRSGWWSGGFGFRRGRRRRTRRRLGEPWGVSPRGNGVLRRLPVPLDDKQHLPRLDLVPLLHHHLAHLAGERRRHLDRALLGLHFHQRLALFHVVADLDLHVDDVASGHVLAQGGQLDFTGHGGPLLAANVGEEALGVRKRTAGQIGSSF